MKHGKKYIDSVKAIDSAKLYDAAEGINAVLETAKAKFDETIELHVRLGVDPKQADQQVRGVIVLPNGTGKNVRVLVLAKGEKAEFNQTFAGFSNFVNNFVTGLLYTIFLFLWCLIPVVGIIKSYSYAMTFYIMKDHPEMKKAEAITASRKMMNGHKMDLFILQLSFIGWILLSCLTFGILLIYVGPYMSATEAAFYEKLKAEQAQ